jgi:hypothetical protein
VVLAIANRYRKAAGLIVWLGITAYLSLGPRYLPFDEIMNRVPFGNFVYAIRSPGKYLIFGEAALAALAGAGVRQLAVSLRAWRRRLPWLAGLVMRSGERLALLASALIAGEMLFWSLQVNSLYPETWVGARAGYAETLEWVRQTGDRTSRLLNTSVGDLEATALSDQPAFNSHNEESLPSKRLFWETIDLMDDDAADDELSARTRDGLYLLDVGYIVTELGLPPDPAWQAGLSSPPFSAWQVAEHSPAIAAPVLAQHETSFSLKQIEDMHIDRENNSAAFLPVQTMPAAAGEVALAASRAPLQLTVIGYRVNLTSVVLDYEVSDAAFLQLAYSAYPYLEATLDGKSHEYFRTGFDFVGLATPAGSHRVELRPVLSPLRQAANALDVIGLLLIGVLASWRRLRRGR